MVRIHTDRSEWQSSILRDYAIVTGPATVFALLTASNRMSDWLAQDVTARPQPGGVFRLSDPNGCWVEGTYVELKPDQLVAFTWGGIEGLGIGQSVVTFTLEFDGHATVVGLRHTQLTESAVNMHRLGWMQFGLPRLKAVAEGASPKGTYLALLGSIARTRLTYPAVHCPVSESHSLSIKPALMHAEPRQSC